MFIKKFFNGGVKVPHFKNTSDFKTRNMGVPETVVIPMLQHIGAMCKPIVSKGQEVKVGQMIGDSDQFVSAPIHSSVSGTVTRIFQMLYPGGINIDCVEIKTDGKQEIFEGIKPPKYSNYNEFVNIIRQSGLVGLGGAGFPTHVKLSPPPDKVIDILVINAAECEPYITSDYMEILENSKSILDGIKILADLLNIKSVFIGIEDNKPKAIRILENITKEDDRINVVKLKSKYPQGAEKMLIYTLTKRKVPPEKLPLDVGVIVLNITSASFIAEHIKTGMPLIKRRVTVDGSAIEEPANVEVLIGTSLKEVFDFCGGFKSDPAKILMGGPMMGIAQFSIDTSVIKQTNALLAFDKEEARIENTSNCIRCGKCVKACPMNLMPAFLNLYTINKNIDELKRHNIADCIECGSCSYVCPAKIQIVQSVKLGKLIVKNSSKKERI